MNDMFSLMRSPRFAGECLLAIGCLSGAAAHAQTPVPLVLTGYNAQFVADAGGKTSPNYNAPGTTFDGSQGLIYDAGSSPGQVPLTTYVQETLTAAQGGNAKPWLYINNPKSGTANNNNTDAQALDLNTAQTLTLAHPAGEEHLYIFDATGATTYTSAVTVNFSGLASKTFNYTVYNWGASQGNSTCAQPTGAAIGYYSRTKNETYPGGGGSTFCGVISEAYIDLTTVYSTAQLAANPVTSLTFAAYSQGGSSHAAIFDVSATSATPAPHSLLTALVGGVPGILQLRRSCRRR